MDQFPVSAKTFFQPRLDDTQQRLLWKIASLLFTGMGLAGSVPVGAATVTGTFWAFHALSDSVIAGITYGGGTTGGVTGGDTVKAGDRIYGNIVSLTLASGGGELYKASAP